MIDADALAADAVARIDRTELENFALDICRIDSPVGHEGAAGTYLYEWLRANGFAARRIGLSADRFNVLARLPGTGGGESLLFNGHLDTYAPDEPDFVHLDATRAELHSAWIEDDLLVGDGIVNDKGPIAAFCIAAKAVRDTGVALPGDLLVSGVIAETAHEPYGDAPGAIADAKELGARMLATHGGVADHVLVAEGTAFGLVWVEAGKFWYEITLRSSQPAFYTPYVPGEAAERVRSNMIVAAADAIGALERWALGYERANTRTFAGGTIVPKVQIGAIRSGDPSRPFLSPQICTLHLDVRSLPGADPLAVREDIAQVLRDAHLDASVELYVFRPGYEGRGIEPLAATITAAHRATFGSDPQPPPAATCSMWRDSNIFAELGIPAINYGPRSATHAYKRALTRESLYQAACVYARTAVAICSRMKHRE
jgi:acetylornithine deacetylase/succinyl-diaminopimelate desuccinylase-like protein